MGQLNFTWWNLQNLFDTDDDPISQDFEFTVAQGWTPAVFDAKMANLAAALRATHGGEDVELLAVCEIEKDALLRQLGAAMGLEHLTVVEDLSGTSDLRGIDVALAYDDRKLELLGATSHLLHLRYRTRDLFEVRLRVRETREELVVIAGHWPSRRLGRFESEPSRIAVAENVAFLLDGHVKVAPGEYERLRAQDDLEPVRRRWEAKVLVVGDFNDEPHDRSVVNHLLASHELERVTGETNDVDGFARETATYRGREVYLYNATWPFLTRERAGTYFFDRSPTGVPNRYQVLDQLVVSRGLLGPQGLRLDLASVRIFDDALVATPAKRPRGFDRKTKRGTSDHLPLTAVLRY